MGDLLATAYLWVKALHVISVIAWMAGLFYLPRLFVYHVEQVAGGSDTDALFQTMETAAAAGDHEPGDDRDLGLRPGAGLHARASWTGRWSGPGPRRSAVLAMTWFHVWLGLRRKDFAGGTQHADRAALTG